MGLKTSVIRAGHANMFLSELFCETFANVTGMRLELYNTDGSQGAARGAGVGNGYYSTMREAFENLSQNRVHEPDQDQRDQYGEAYLEWKAILEALI